MPDFIVSNVQPRIPGTDPLEGQYYNVNVLKKTFKIFAYNFTRTFWFVQIPQVRAVPSNWHYINDTVLTHKGPTKRG